tara:strand:- start:576 stop:1250 length:675 start_codon:yes stop_codon:yes gene_type:complete
MKKLLALLLLVTTTIFAQKTVERELGSFNEVKIFNGLNVTLKKETNSSIKITGKKAEEVVVKNVNGKLKLSMRFPETFNSDEAEVTIHYSENLSVIDVNEGSYVTADTILKQQHVELRAQEGAVIDLDIEVKYLEVKSVTGASIVLSGMAENQNIEATTGGSYKAYGLKSNYATIISATGSFVRVSVSELLDAKVRLGGTVYYKGNPKDVKEKKIIGGTIKSKD